MDVSRIPTRGPKLTPARATVKFDRGLRGIPLRGATKI